MKYNIKNLIKKFDFVNDMIHKLLNDPGFYGNLVG